MKFETGIFTEFVRYVKQDWMVFCAAIILCAGTVFFETILGRGNIRHLDTPIFAFIAIRVHRLVLTPKIENLKPYDGYMMLSYAWRLVVLVLLSSYLSIFIFQAFGEMRQGTKFLGGLLSIGIIYGLFLSIFGTVFPALVTNFDSSISAASNRTSKTFVYIFLRLFLVVGSLKAVTLAANFYITVKFKVGDVITPNGELDIFSLLLTLSEAASSLAITVLASIVLSRAFLLSGNLEGKAKP